jgi:transcriptional regulator with XRE-family HTH domain
VISGHELSPEQSRAARRLLNWSIIRLCGRSSLSENTIRNFEEGRRTLSANHLAALRDALEAAGVEFTNGKRPGVRLRRAARQT